MVSNKDCLLDSRNFRSEMVFKKTTGSTHGMRFKIAPPKKAKRSARSRALHSYLSGPAVEVSTSPVTPTIPFGVFQVAVHSKSGSLLAAEIFHSLFSSSSTLIFSLLRRGATKTSSIVWLMSFKSRITTFSLTVVFLSENEGDGFGRVSKLRRRRVASADFFSPRKGIEKSRSADSGTH